MTRRPQGCAFWGFGWRPTILRGSTPQKKPKKAFSSRSGKIIKSQYLRRGDRIDTKFWHDNRATWMTSWGGPKLENSNSRWRTAAILENVGDAITRLSMGRFGRKLSGRIPSCPRHIRHNAVAMTMVNIQQLWASGGRTREPILMKFGTQQQITTSITVSWSNITIFKIQNGGQPPCCKSHNSFINGPIGTKLGWSYPIMSPICLPWCGCHGDGRCLATAQHSVMGVWRPNARTNFDEIYYTTAT